MPYDYIKVHRGFFQGTFYSESLPTKIVFLAMIVECSRGIYLGTPDALSRFTGIPVADVLAALRDLSKPDPASTSDVYGGRRIIPVEGVRNTWKIVNFEKYQPALVDKNSSAPKIEVIDKQGRIVSPYLENGTKNPEYHKLYMRQYRKKISEERRAGSAIEKDVDGIKTATVKPVSENRETSQTVKQCENSVSQNLTETVKCFTDSETLFEPETEGKEAETVKPVNEIKENKRKGFTVNNKTSMGEGEKKTEKTSRGRRTKKAKTSHLESFDRFVNEYPKHVRTCPWEAEPLWDVLVAEHGEETLIAAARRYCRDLTINGKLDYTKGMASWLRQEKFRAYNSDLVVTQSTLLSEQRKPTTMDAVAAMVRTYVSNGGTLDE